jgi:hypothetical protein
MVDVTHDGHDRRARDPPHVVGMRGGANQRRLWPNRDGGRGCRNGGLLWGIANLLGDFRRRVIVDDLIDAGKDTKRNQVADYLVDRDAEQLRQVFDDDLRRKRDWPTWLDGDGRRA